jgi:hypothetical protein
MWQATAKIRRTQVLDRRHRSSDLALLSHDSMLVLPMMSSISFAVILIDSAFFLSCACGWILLKHLHKPDLRCSPSVLEAWSHSLPQPRAMSWPYHCWLIDERQWASGSRRDFFGPVECALCGCCCEVKCLGETGCCALLNGGREGCASP